MESRLLEILVCPVCKGSLRYDRQRQELICRADRLAYPVRDGVPVMLENEARDLQSGGPSRAPSEPSGPLQADADTSADQP